MLIARDQERHTRSIRDLLHVVEVEPAGKRIVHFHVAKLAPARAEARKIRKAVDFIRDSIERLGSGDVTIAPNRDIVCWMQGIKLANIISICRKIENYFCGDDEFTERNYYGDVYFYTVIDAGMELGKFRAFAVSMIDFATTAVKSEAPKELISIENFSQIVDIVRHSNMSAFVFNQPIYNITHPKTSIEFIEFYVGMRNFEDTLCPQYSIMGDSWLFNRLTEEFDRAVLRHMHLEMASYRHKAFSLNLNLKSVFSKEFALFAEGISAAQGGRVILEINKLSMLNDWGLFAEVYALARQKGFKVCIDGLDLADVCNLKLANLNFDFAKMKWSASAFSNRQSVERAVRTLCDIDPGKVILHMCDSEAAFAFAKAIGIRFVQGRLADKYFKNAFPI